jgi:hypothetical protein
MTRAADIASNGVIACSCFTGTGKWRPAIWERDEFTPLDDVRVPGTSAGHAEDTATVNAASSSCRS